MKTTLSLTLMASLLALSTACATARGPRQSDFTAATRTWSRVAQLAPATEIAVTTARVREAPRVFVDVDDMRLIVINLTNPALPAETKRVLRNLAAQHGHDITAIESGRSFQDGAVRIGRDGVIVGGTKVAEFAQVVEMINRSDVREIRGPVVATGSALGTALGAFVGFAVGAVPGLGGASPEATWLALIASMAAGGYLGFRWSSHQTDGVVYQAP